MTHFFYQRISKDDRWALIPQATLESAESFELVIDPSRPIRIRRNGGGSGAAAHIMRFSDRNDKTAWVLFSSGGVVRVNGLSIPGGIHLLEHRDEVVVGAENRFVFSTETVAEVRPFRGDNVEGEEVKCGRCTLKLEEGQDSTRCPGCNSVFHEMEGKNCFTYSRECPNCRHSTELGGGFKWMPDDNFRREGGGS